VRAVLLYNPAAGAGRAARVLPDVLARLRAGGMAVGAHRTASLDEARRTARELAGEVDALIAMGGDGTVGACAAGLGQAGPDARAALGLIPTGTGNDVARTLGLPFGDPLQAATMLPVLPRRRVDLGVVRAAPGGAAGTVGTGERWFIDVASAGFDAEVNRLANERLARAPSLARYAGATIARLLVSRPATFQLTIDGAVHQTGAWFVAVSNCRSYGGGMRIAPDAMLNDGRFDVVVVGAFSKPRFLATFPQVFTGRHVNHPLVTVHRAATVELAADRPQRVYADGEPAGTLPAVFQVLPAAISVLAPADVPSLGRAGG